MYFSSTAYGQSICLQIIPKKIIGEFLELRFHGLFNKDSPGSCMKQLKYIFHNKLSTFYYVIFENLLLDPYMVPPASTPHSQISTKENRISKVTMKT
jgi:hypothetical protein